MKHGYSLYLIFSAFLMLWGCSDLINQEGSKEEIILSEENKKKYKKYKDSILNINKDRVIKLYDNIGFIAMNWIATDRIEYTNDTLKPVLENLSLQQIRNKFDEINNETTKRKSLAHVDFLLNSRKKLLDGVTNSKANYVKELESLVLSPYYKDTLISKSYIPETKRNDKEKEDKYLENLGNVEEEIKSEIRKAKLDFKETLSRENWRKKIGKEVFSLGKIKPLGLWFSSLFLISLLINILQYIRYKKKTKRLKKELSKTRKQPTSNPSIQNKKSQDDYKPKPSQLSPHSLKSGIESAYETMQKSLMQRYHPDCVRVQEVTYNTFLSDTMEEAQSKRFTSQQDLTSYLSIQINKHQIVLEKDIQECISRDVARQQIQSSVTATHFLTTVNTTIISESEVRSKIESLKNSFIDELPITTTQEQLAKDIENLNKDIEAQLVKMQQDNLIFYFPFADVRGALSDNKKSKTKARDSALYLSLHPNDITKATFHLILDQEQMMQAGIMSYDSLLLPICELKPENYNSAGTRVEEIGNQGGIMVLEDGKWRVKEKLPIKIV